MFKKAISAFTALPEFRRLTLQTNAPVLISGGTCDLTGTVEMHAYAAATALAPTSPTASGVAAAIALSYSYGFYRSWTLPIWKNCEYTDYPLRIGLSTVSGFAYIVPPFCVMKYMNLALRVRDYKNGWDRRECSEQWTEWGFYHDRVL